MKETDQKIRKILQNNSIKLDENAAEKIEFLLENLPEKEIGLSRKKRYHGRLKWVFACIAVAFILPNIHPQIAMAMQEIPIIGHFFEVITIRNYLYEDSKHNAEIEQPKIIVEGTSDGVEVVNKDTEKLVNEIILDFEKSIEADSYLAIYVKYDILCNTEKWFTLRLNISEVSGSSEQYSKIYHIDKTTGVYVKLDDLFKDEAYIDAISQNVYEQMVYQMNHRSEDNYVDYWIDSVHEDIDACYEISPEQNFYFNSEGEIVIVYDKYVVGPGSMGCPEFLIPSEVYKSYLK